MKERTFEELIDNAHYVRTQVDDSLIKYEYKREIPDSEIPNLLQQVREATIKECVEILQNPNIPKSRMESFPTDRIKTEK